MPPQWTIWYTDGSTFTSEQGSPNDSPPWGAALISQRVANQDMLAYQKDFFVYRSDEGRWFEVDHVGFLDMITHFAPVVECVRPGRWMATEKWKELQRRAAVALRGK